MFPNTFKFAYPVYYIERNSMTEEKIDYHVDNCTCYGCRQGTTLKEKDKPKIVNCQICNKHKDKCDDWNDYYKSCEGCLK